MFAHPQSNVVEAFTPSALPDFLATPASIPDRGSLPRSLFGLLWHTCRGSLPLKTLPIRLVRSLSPCVARCRLRPRGEGLITRLSAIAPVACVSCESFGLPNFGSFGATYRIQLLSLHLATCLHSLLRFRVVRLRPFPVGFPPTRLRTISRFHRSHPA